MNPIEQFQKDIQQIEASLGYTFQDKSLLILAFTHRSFVNENRELVNDHNERLEFLGDSVLGILVSEYLYKYLPTTPEGELSYLRSRLVEASSCITYVQKLNIEKYVLLGKGEQLNDGRGRESILSDLFEAIIGAIFLDSGLSETKRFLFQNFSLDINDIMRKPLLNWKAVLQDYSQKNYHVTPIYVVMDEYGPDHNKIFAVTVKIQEKVVGKGQGTSKKEAQQNAAECAVKKLGIEIQNNG